MSYILDALRKAEAQRGRQRLPGLQAQQLAASAPAPARGWAASPRWIAAALASMLVATALWWKFRSPQSVVATASEPPAVASPAVTAASQQTASSAMAPAAPVIVPAPPPSAVQDPVPRPSVGAAPAAAKPAQAAQPSQVAPAGAPTLAITGGVYSPNPAQRMLIVNGQVFNEGSEVAAGVTLEQVKPNQAVLNYRGERYTVRY